MDRVMHAVFSGPRPMQKQNNRRRFGDVNALPNNQGNYRGSFNNTKIASPEYFDANLREDQYRGAGSLSAERLFEARFRDDQQWGTESQSAAGHFEARLREDQHWGAGSPSAVRHFETRLREDQYRGAESLSAERHFEARLREEQHRGAESSSNARYFEPRLREDQHRATESSSNARHFEPRLRKHQHRATESPSNARYLELRLREEKYRGTKSPPTARTFENNLFDDLHGATEWSSTLRYNSPPIDKHDTDAGLDPNGGYFTKEYITKKRYATRQPWMGYEKECEVKLTLSSDTSNCTLDDRYSTMQVNWMGNEKKCEVKRTSSSDTSNRTFDDRYATMQVDWMGNENECEVKRTSSSETSNRTLDKSCRLACGATSSKKGLNSDESSPKLEEARADTPSAEAQEIFLKGIRECARHRFNVDVAKKQWKIDEIEAAVEGQNVRGSSSDKSTIQSTSKKKGGRTEKKDGIEEKEITKEDEKLLTRA